MQRISSTEEGEKECKGLKKENPASRRVGEEKTSSYCRREEMERRLKQGHKTGRKGNQR